MSALSPPGACPGAEHSTQQALKRVCELKPSWEMDFPGAGAILGDGFPRSRQVPPQVVPGPAHQAAPLGVSEFTHQSIKHSERRLWKPALAADGEKAGERSTDQVPSPHGSHAILTHHQEIQCVSAWLTRWGN